MTNRHPTPRVHLEEQHKAYQNLRHVPWAIDGRVQDYQGLEKTLCNEAARYTKDQEGPIFSLLTPMWNTDPRHLEELIWSCLAQSYGGWELILYDDGSQKSDHLVVARSYAANDDRIKLTEGKANGGISAGRNFAYRNSSGDFIAILDHDDLIHPQTLGILARSIIDQPSTNFLYSNECKLADDSKSLSDFFSKPTFDWQTLLRTNYLCHFTAIHRDLYEIAQHQSGDYYQSEYDGVEDHEFFLRCALQGEIEAVHLPLYLYYWRISPSSTAGDLENKPGVVEKGRQMVEDKARLAYGHPTVTVEAPDTAAGQRFFQIKLHPEEKTSSSLAIIIPFRNEGRITRRCLEALERQDLAGGVSVILIDNGSTVSESQEIRRWTEGQRRHRYTILNYDHPFNFGAMNNLAISQLDSSIKSVLLLNNDVTLVDQNALSMLHRMLWTEAKIAHTSLRLNFPGTRRVQYGGVEWSDELVGSGSFMPAHLGSPDAFVFDDHIQPISGFACCLIKRTAYESIGPFNETTFANGLGDLEWCLRAYRAGFKGFYLGSLHGYHDESLTRGSNDEDLALSLLHSSFSQEIRGCRTEQMGYNIHLGLNSADRSFGKLRQPLRYQLADRLNSALKGFSGPLHRSIRRRLRR